MVPTNFLFYLPLNFTKNLNSWYFKFPFGSFLETYLTFLVVSYWLIFVMGIFYYVLFIHLIFYIFYPAITISEVPSVCICSVSFLLRMACFLVNLVTLITASFLVDHLWNPRGLKWKCFCQNKILFASLGCQGYYWPGIFLHLLASWINEESQV